MAVEGASLTASAALTGLVGLVGQLADLDVLEADGVAVVLQEDVALGLVAEVGPVAVFAVGHEGVPLLRVALIFEELDVVEPVLDMVAADDDHGGVELVEDEGLVVADGDEVVEGPELAVALDAELGVGVTQVVEDLEFAADGRSGALVEGGVDEVLDAAVGTLSDLEVDAEHEVAPCAGGDDVAAVGALGTVAGMHLQLSVGDGPSLFGEGVELGAAPAVGGLAVEEELPSLCLLGWRERVVDEVHLGRAVTVGLHQILLDILGADAQVAPADGLLFVVLRAHLMHLQGDEPLGTVVVPETGAGLSVDVGADEAAAALDAGLVPLVVAEGVAGLRVLRQRIEPQAVGLVVDAARPCAVAGVDLKLVAVDAPVLIVLGGGAAELYARVEPFADAEFELEDEVAVLLLRGEERVGLSQDGLPDDGVVLHLKLGPAVQQLPSAEVLAVEQWLPLLCPARQTQGQAEHDGRDSLFHCRSCY